jgi:hypothetical protein
MVLTAQVAWSFAFCTDSSRTAAPSAKRFECSAQSPPEQHGHLALGPEGRGPDQDPLERLLAREIFLRERRALIGQLGLVADDRDRAFELVLPQRDPRLRAGMARADDQDVVSSHVMTLIGR